MIRTIPYAIYRWFRLVGRKLDNNWVGPIAAWDIAWSSARDRFRNWDRYERDLLLATGVADIESPRDAWGCWRAQRKLRRRAKRLAEDNTYFALCAREGSSRHRLNGFIAMLRRSPENMAKHITPHIIRERWLLASYEMACDMRQRAENRMEVK